MNGLYAFGPFLLDAGQRLLLRDGKPVPLTPKAVDTLLVLVRNAGRLVGKGDLMQEVWPDAFVEEVNLAKNIFVLRHALGDGEHAREYIETVPKRGYRFVASVRECVGESEEGGGFSPAELAPSKEIIEHIGARTPAELKPRPSSAVFQQPTRIQRRPWRLATLLIAIALALAAGLLWLSSTPPPAVLKITQITHFGRVAPASRLVTDGARIYFEEIRGGRLTLVAVPVEGGEPVVVPTPFPNTALYGISPDHSELLVGSYPGGPPEPELWVVPTAGGSPRRVGNVFGHDAAWSRDGQKIAYFSGSGLYVVKPDGSDRRQLATTEGRGWFSRWAPDGKALRFGAFGTEIPSLSLWEVDAKGGNPHRLLVGWREPPAYYGDGESDGDWTPDGKYFVFRSTRAGMASIWAIAERGKFLRRSSGNPVQLMTTDSSLWSLLAAKNRIFYPGDKEVRELARYDTRLKQFFPYLPGVRARDVDFSRDGQWVAYVVPDMQQNILWRSRVDGSDRQQLTFPPMHAVGPRWSPDGKKIAFAGIVPGKRTGIFLLSSGGGEPELVTPSGLDSTFPDWSPGGELLLFSGPVRASGRLLTGENGGMYQVDLKTMQLSVFPGAEGLLNPCWSPDGRYLAALASGGKLMVFDSRSRGWRELAQGTALRPARWSRDSKYAYSQDVEGSQPIFRVRISDRKIEPIVTFEEIQRADVRSYALAAVAPDGSPVVSLVLSHSDIYALDLKFP